jgi:hypothetical protein
VGADVGSRHDLVVRGAAPTAAPGVLPAREINEIDPATISIGEPVQVVYQQIDDVTMPRWVRA